MALSINTNIASLNAQRNLVGSQVSLQTSINRLSSGLRVNSAADDAAGIAIGTRMGAQASGMAVAIRNANDGISLAQTADSGLSAMGDILTRMRDLAVQAINGTYADSGSDLANLDTEFQSLSLELTRVTTSTKFNAIDVIGAGATTFTLQVGANSGDTLDIVTANASAYMAASDVTTHANATTALGNIDTAINSVNTDRATYGAAINRLNYTVTNLQASMAATKAAQGRIMDADFAAETANMTRANVLQQAGTAVLAQANALPNQVLTLLR